MDTDALTKAFRFDQGALQPDLSALGSLDMDTVDLSGMLDASQLGEGMPDLDMNAILPPRFLFCTKCEYIIMYDDLFDNPPYRTPLPMIRRWISVILVRISLSI